MLYGLETVPVTSPHVKKLKLEVTEMKICMWASGHTLRGFAKLKFVQKSKINLDGTRPPTQPPSKLFLLETRHWHGQNTQIIIINTF